MLSVELHTHSAASYDGTASVEAILERAAEVGLDAVAVTDHDELAASLRAVERASEYDLVAIPGMEVSSAAGHVLALGIETPIGPALSFGETLDRIREQGGLAVIPHPFQELRSGVLANITGNELATADAIEVYNSRLFTGRANRQAKRFAQRRNLPMTAGSDAHIAEMVGQAITRVDPPEVSVEGILEEIRQGRTTVEGKRTPWRISAKQTVAGVRRWVGEHLGGR